ncbi:potassium transporter TrkH [Myxococcaceae bacterium JPH2]|nr:potassium transporter TrkH [Myxococcaceae bacterium JPH2]
MARLRIGECVCDVDDALLAAARPRCQAGPFLVGPESHPDLWLERDTALSPGGHLFQRARPELGGFALEGSTLRTSAPLSTYPAEFALRALFQLAVLRQGGFCVHGAGVVLADAALVALGPSGAGKSTLSRLCLQSGAALLSDELVALLPGGRVLGSPFSSEPDLAASRVEARAHALLLLEKAPAERLTPVASSELLAALLGQRFRAVAELEPGPRVLTSVGAVVADVPGFRLAFRKDVAVAGFLAEWVAHGTTASGR